MRQSVSGTAAKISEVKMLIFNALKHSSRIITKANPPPTTNQNNSPSKAPVLSHNLEQFALQAPRPAFGIVGTVRFRESDSVFHWKVPTSMVELPMPKAVNNRSEERRVGK